MTTRRLDGRKLAGIIVYPSVCCPLPDETLTRVEVFGWSDTFDVRLVGVHRLQDSEVISSGMAWMDNYNYRRYAGLLAAQGAEPIRERSIGGWHLVRAVWVLCE